jgi:DNA-binding NtrC family response regulator
MHSTSQAQAMLTILIADEEENSRTLIAETLKRLPHHVSFASTPAEAAGMLERTNYDLLIFDTWSKSMPGLTLFERAKERNEFIEGIIVSGAVSIYGALDAYRTGIFDFLSKPLDDPEKLVQAVNGVAQKRAYWLNLLHTLDYQRERT